MPVRVPETDELKNFATMEKPVRIYPELRQVRDFARTARHATFFMSGNPPTEVAYKRTCESLVNSAVAANDKEKLGLTRYIISALGRRVVLPVEVSERGCCCMEQSLRHPE